MPARPSPPRACSWPSGQLTKAPQDTLKMRVGLAAGGKNRVFSAGLVLVGRLQREILARRRAGQSPEGEDAGLGRGACCLALGEGRSFQAHLYPCMFSFGGGINKAGFFETGGIQVQCVFHPCTCSSCNSDREERVRDPFSKTEPEIFPEASVSGGK